MRLGAIGNDRLGDGGGDFPLEQAIEIVAVEDEWIGIFLPRNCSCFVLVGDQNLTGAGRTADARARLAA